MTVKAVNTAFLIFGLFKLSEQAGMPHGRKKMILIGTTENIDIKASKIDTDEPRYIPLNNITQIAESHIKNLGLTIKPQILSNKAQSIFSTRGIKVSEERLELI